MLKNFWLKNIFTSSKIQKIKNYYLDDCIKLIKKNLE